MRISRKRWLALAGATVLATTTIFVATNAYADPGGTITGHLLDNGVPVPNVNVALLTDGPPVPLPPTSTDASGAFTLADVPTGAYRVSFRLPGFVTFFAHGSTTFEGSDLIDVADGATVTLEETVPPHGAISGRLTRPDGSGVSAFVQAFGGAGSLSTSTDPTGAYTLPYVWVGSYRVQFSPSGAPQQFAHQKPDFPSADVFPVAAGVTTTVDDVLLPSGTITGRVTNQGSAVSFASVQIIPSTAQFDQTVATTVTNFDGTYRVDVPAGSYKVKVRFPSGISQYAHQNTSLAAADTFTVVEGETIVVDENALVPSTIRGTLTNEDGSPAMGAFVSVRSGFDFFGTAVGPTGEWSVSVLPGTYTVSFSTQLGTQWAFGKTSESTADPITVGSGATVEVNDVLLAPGSVTFTATDHKTGAPLTEFCVSHSFGGPCTTTGSITVTARAGDFWAFVTTEDQAYIPAEVRLTVVSGQDIPIAVSLIKAATVNTVIKDAETGAPVSGACVSLVSPVNPTMLIPFGGTCSGPNGAVAIRGVTPGVYNAFVNVHDGVHGMQWVGLSRGTGAQARARLILASEGATVTVPDIKLDKAGTVTGTVRDEATGAPLEDAFVALASFNSGAGHGIIGDLTDDQGRYSFGDLGPYAWTFFFRHGIHASVFSGGTGDRFFAQGVKINVGQTTTYDLNMRGGTLFTGMVRRADGTPPEFARITLVHALSGDELSNSDVMGAQPYELHVAGPLLVKLRIDGGPGLAYVGGADFFSAKVFLVGSASPQVQDITVP